MNAFTYIDGEIQELKAVEQTHETDTNDLRYVFIDLTEKHKTDNLLGIKILSVTPK
jgi:hypothetical protein